MTVMLWKKISLYAGTSYIPMKVRLPGRGSKTISRKPHRNMRAPQRLHARLPKIRDDDIVQATGQ